MGITIHYQGKIKEIKLIPKLVNEFKDFAETAGWEYKIIDCRPDLVGLTLNIHPDCETLFLTFGGEDGKLKFFYNYKGRNGQVKTKEGLFLSVKTQFAGVKIHVLIIKLLEYVKKKYIPNLRIEDEGDFWGKKDIKILEENFARVQSLINGLERALKTHKLGEKIEPPFDKAIEEIEKRIKSIPYQEFDIIENKKEEDLWDDDYDSTNPKAIMTEEQWEEHFKENETLMEKYEKVYREKPDRIWKHPYDLYCKVHYGIDFGEDFSLTDLKDEEELTGAKEKLELESEPHSHPLIDEHELERKTHPILEESFEFSMAVMDFAKGLEGREDIQESLSKFVSAALQISAKLHGGHGMGYEMDVLEGNIATCKIALRNANLAIETLEELKPRIGDLIFFAKIDEKLKQLKIDVENWIAELRKRVWWR